ncbi:hypothetical protein P9VFCI_247 [Rhizobium phage P9VFCI]|uniref:Uncharacterized protein n=2 Tax=Innesvirus TaxID=3044739 RepID=A0A076YKH4_9CAUD|nr:hypothetical protein P10VF_044 [Rhizobium phage vB_RleM_P10VF]YP_010662140.1 hypothetical protein PP937_gp247 [Rhizobium phage P9VFCI]AIK68257.1 hypothetical protein P10VF_044 [Rhizobium phage vB_RleM_P10VF]QNH72019.1 hypothetical protein P9VFCI_247 [Rhizobium phage P9VFCI]
MNVLILFKRFELLMEAAESGKILSFEMLHDEVTKCYKKLDIGEQGKFHEMVTKKVLGN